MAALFRIGIYKIITNHGQSKLLSNTKELKIAFRGIAGKNLKFTIPQISKPEPWPYTEKKYTFFNYLYDKTTSRFDQNSKIIVVEGPVAACKSSFAKELAKELEMYYMPEANLDMFYTNNYGFNLKQLDNQVPIDLRSFDIKDFLLNPRHKLTASFQIKQLIVKYSQYIDALAHVLSTGQGVILDRCVYSDFVFVEAMYKQKYISKAARSIYYDMRRNTTIELLKPHLVIYLDMPVDRVLGNIKNRNYDCEISSSVLTKDYLQTMENTYKQNYLKDISEHAELLIYDWSDQGEIEVVVEDIERLKFERFDDHDPKLEDWDQSAEEEWALLRNKYADKKEQLLMYTNIPRFDAPELIVEAEDMKKYWDIVNNAPGMEYAYGYNSSLGDTGIFFKTKINHRETLPLIERKFP